LPSLPPRRPRSPLFPYTTLFRSMLDLDPQTARDPVDDLDVTNRELGAYSPALAARPQIVVANKADLPETQARREAIERHCATTIDRKSTRLNSSHVSISYAVFCL